MPEDQDLEAEEIDLILEVKAGKVDRDREEEIGGLGREVEADQEIREVDAVPGVPEAEAEAGTILIQGVTLTGGDPDRGVDGVTPPNHHLPIPTAGEKERLKGREVTEVEESSRKMRGRSLLKNGE